MKHPILKVRTSISEQQLKVDQVFADGQASCVFTNGVYQQP